MAWDDVKSATIMYCWRHAALSPASIVAARNDDEPDTEDVLNAATEVLGIALPMTMEEFVDIDVAIGTGKGLSMTEILDLVGEKEDTGGGDDDLDVKLPLPPPSRVEAKKALSMFTRYAEAHMPRSVAKVAQSVQEMEQHSTKKATDDS